MISDIYLGQINTAQKEQSTADYHGNFTYNLKGELYPHRKLFTYEIHVDMTVISTAMMAPMYTTHIKRNLEISSEKTILELKIKRSATLTITSSDITTRRITEKMSSDLEIT